MAWLMTPSNCDGASRPVTSPAEPIGPGVFVAIGGPSGVGKDSVIRYARDRLMGDPRIVFVQRTITRRADASEDHLSIDEAGFKRLTDNGAFALTWLAHGLHYGLPIEIDGAIADGRVAVANVSRTVLPALRARYTHVLAIAITADPAIIRSRLTDRGRESSDAISERVQRFVANEGDDWIELQNSGPIEEAGEGLLRICATRRASAED